MKNLKPINYRESLGRMLLEYSYRRGKFKLTSGKESDFYIDCKKTILTPMGAWLVGNCFCDIITSVCGDVQAVAGITLGADPLVTATSVVGIERSLDLPQIIIRKEPKNHGSGNWLEEAATVPVNASVALFDDVLTTGGTLVRIGVKALESKGHTVSAIILIVDREEGGREFLIESGYSNVYSIFTRTELLALQETPWDH